MTIEEIIDFDKNNLSDYKLIYSKMGKTSYWIYNAAMLFFIVLFFFPIIWNLFSEKSNYWTLLFCPPSLLALIYLIQFRRRKIVPILKNYISKYDLDMTATGNISTDRKLISNLQYRILADYLGKKTKKTTNEDIDKIIDALKYELLATKYNYQALTITIAFLTILTSTLLATFLKLGTEVDVIIKMGIKSVMILIIIALLLFEIEEFIIKGIILTKRNRYQRLIRILENFSINF